VVEAQIFEPQILMLDDLELVDGTVAYIRDNHLSAARAFELRMLELHSEWSRSGHPMIMDRLNDLVDVQHRVTRRLLGSRTDLEPGGGRGAASSWSRAT
jgi:phosphoenolpyruvate-protein phosphotransferase (PTS system enzyme I)